MNKVKFKTINKKKYSNNNNFDDESSSDDEPTNQINDDQGLITFDNNSSSEEDNDDVIDNDKKKSVNVVANDGLSIEAKLQVQDLMKQFLKKQKKIEVKNEKDIPKDVKKDKFIIPINESKLRVDQDKSFKEIIEQLKKKIPDENLGQTVINELQSFIDRIHDPLYVFLGKVAFNLKEKNINRFIKMFSDESEEHLLESLIQLETKLGKGPFTTKQVIQMTTQTLKKIKKIPTSTNKTKDNTIVKDEPVNSTIELLKKLGNMTTEIQTIKQSLTNQFNLLKKKFEDSEGTIKILTEKLDQQSNKRKRVQVDETKLNNVINKNKELESIIVELNDTVKNITELKNSSVNEQDRLLKSINESNNKILNLNNQIEQLKNTSGSDQSNINDLKNEITDLKNTITSSEKTIKVFKEEKNNLSSQLNSATNNIKEYVKLIGSITGDDIEFKGESLEFLLKNFITFSNVLKNVQSNRTQNLENIKNLTEENNKLKKLINEQQTKFQTELSSLKIENGKLKQEINKLKNEINNLRDKNDVHIENATNLQSKLNQSNNKNKETLNQLDIIVGKLPNYKSYRNLLLNIIKEIEMDKSNQKAVLKEVVQQSINTVTKELPEGELTLFMENLIKQSMRNLLKKITTTKPYNNIVKSSELYKKFIGTDSNGGLLFSIIDQLSTIDFKNKKIQTDNFKKFVSIPVETYRDSNWKETNAKIIFNSDFLIVQTIIHRYIVELLSLVGGYTFNKNDYQLSFALFQQLTSKLISNKNISELYKGIFNGSNDITFTNFIEDIKTNKVNLSNIVYTLMDPPSNTGKRKIKKINFPVLDEFFDNDDKSLIFNVNVPESTKKINHYLKKMHDPYFLEHAHLHEIHNRWFSGDKIGAIDDDPMEGLTDIDAKKDKKNSILNKLIKQEMKLLEQKNKLTDLWINDVTNQTFLLQINQTQQLMNQVRTQINTERTRENVDRLRLLKQLRFESTPHQLRKIIFNEWFWNILEETGNRVISLAKNARNVKGKPELISYIMHETLRDHYARYIALNIRIPEAEDAVIKKRAPMKLLEKFLNEKLLLEEIVFSKVTFIGQSKAGISPLKFSESKFIQTDLRQGHLFKMPDINIPVRKRKERSMGIIPCIQEQKGLTYGKDFDEVHLVKKPKNVHIIDHVKKQHMKKKDDSKKIYDESTFMSLF